MGDIKRKIICWLCVIMSKEEVSKRRRKIVNWLIEVVSKGEVSEREGNEICFSNLIAGWNRT